MKTCFVALGGNLGDTQAVFAAALSSMERLGITIEKKSSLYQSAPMGPNAGELFLNAIVQLKYSGSGLDLLAILHQVEAEFQRTRTIHWGPRSLDLDLLAIECEVIDQPAIVVPHPALWYRRFVVEPFAEIAPDWQHPTLNTSAASLLASMNQSCLYLALAEVSKPDCEELSQKLAPRFADGKFSLSHELRDNTFATLLSAPAIPGRTQPPSPTERVVTVERPGETPLSLDSWHEAAANVLTAALPTGFDRVGPLL